MVMLCHKNFLLPNYTWIITWIFIVCRNMSHNTSSQGAIQHLKDFWKSSYMLYFWFYTSQKLLEVHHVSHWLISMIFVRFFSPKTIFLKWAWPGLSYVLCSPLLGGCSAKYIPPGRPGRAPSHPSVQWAERSAGRSQAEQSRVRGQTGGGTVVSTS